MGEGATKREEVQVKFDPYENGWGGGAENVLPMLKVGRGGGGSQKVFNLNRGA